MQMVRGTAQNLHPMGPGSMAGKSSLIIKFNIINMLNIFFVLVQLLLSWLIKINHPRRITMKKKAFNLILAGALAVTTALPLAVEAGRGGNGSMGGNGIQSQSGTQAGSQLRTRDGSCTNPASTASGARVKSGKGYGPGNGTGNQGVGPQDGTGYGAIAR